MNITILGGGGFLGRKIAARLAEDGTLGVSAHGPIRDVIQAFIEDDLEATRAERAS